MLFSHHIILNGLLDITEILFTTFITPPFIYGAIRIAIHVTGNTKTHVSFYYLSLLILSLLNILFLLTGISNILINSSLTISVDLFSLINFERNSYSAFIIIP